MERFPIERDDRRDIFPEMDSYSQAITFIPYLNLEEFLLKLLNRGRLRTMEFSLQRNSLQQELFLPLYHVASVCIELRLK